MDLGLLLPRIGQDAALQAVLPEMATPGLGTLILPEGVRPAVVALAVKERQKQGLAGPVVVVVPSSRHARRFASAASAWVEGVELFPAWETLPHERLSPQVDTMAQRASVLRRLTRPEPGIPGAGPIAVLVVSVRSFLQTILPQVASVEPVRVAPGGMVDPVELVDQLAALGYQVVDLVEARGQVAARGAIVDVFVPTTDHPLRLEFFGDQVEQARYFRLSDQRTVEVAPEGLWAPPAREFLLTDQVKHKAAELQGKLPGFAELLELAVEGIYAPGVEALAPFLVGETTTLVDLLGPDTLLVASEPEQLRSRSADLVETAQQFLVAAWEGVADGGKVPVQVEESAVLEFAEVWASKKTMAWWDFSALPPPELADATPAGDEVEGSQDQEAGDAPAKVVSSRLAQMGAREVRPYRGDLERAAEDLAALARQGWQLLVTVPAAGAGKRLVQVLGEHDVTARFDAQLEGDFPQGIVEVVPAQVTQGFVMPQLGLGLLTEQDLTGRAGPSTKEMRKLPARRKGGVDPLTLKAGDYVVHNQHGIGRFIEIESRTVGPVGSRVKRDYLVIEYVPSRRGQPADRLYVPTSSLDQVSLYVGSDAPKLSKMGGADWAKTKLKARKAVREIAEELVRLYAARSEAKGFAFSPDTPWQRELEDAFEYTETPDQLATMDEIKADMERPVPMDRLLTGDVGYGKTEIAVRAAFKAVQDGKQVAILVPTTLLAQQHLDTFLERYAGFPINVASLSRFSSTAEAKKVREGLADGSVDVVIGTHTLLTGVVQFKDLGLVIVDEEQRFGVEHKETLKAMRTNVDVLSMSATPIPRTLEMAVAGIREMSVLQTPPEERQPVLTFVGAHTDSQVVAAVRRELLRDGQVFYVHNRVESIDKVAAHLQELVPEARIRVAHGKLSEAELEDVIIDFWNQEFDVLVSTTIIETGLDISNANTLIVDRADTFGLAQLHQLRGRVGRGRDRAYAYLLYSPSKTMSETALDRLRTIAANTDLGSGLAVAQKDLELRGAGNLLGSAQAGQIEGVGFDLYVRMVSEAVAAYKGEATQPEEDVRVELAVDAHLPEDYVPGERLRLEVYSKVAAAGSHESIEHLREELVDRYGPIPRQVQLLMDVATLRERLRKQGITEAITQGKYLRLSPVQLPESQGLRLQRLYPGTVIKPAVRQILVPVGKAGRMGAAAPTDEDLLAWVNQLLTVLESPVAGPRGAAG